jgi:hypothetical protein
MAWESRTASTKDGAYVGAVSFERIRTASQFGTRYVPVLPGSSSAIDLFSSDMASDFDGATGSLFVGLAAVDDWAANGTRREIAKIAATASLNFDGTLGAGAAAPTVGQTGIGDGRTAYSFDGGDYVDVYTSDLAAAFDGAKGTILIWARITDATVWADAASHRFVRIIADASNAITMRKTTVNNQVGFNYVAGGTNKAVTDTSLAASTDWFLIGMTWDKPADEMKAYLQGAQVGATQTGLGTWAGTLDSTATVLGASTTVPAEGHKGLLAHAAVWAGRVLTVTEIAAIYAAQAGNERGAILSYGPTAYWMLGESAGTTAASETNAAGSHYIDIYHTSDGVPTIEYSAGGVVNSWAGPANLAGTSDAPTQVVIGLSWSSDQTLFYLNPTSDVQASVRSTIPTVGSWAAVPTSFVLGASTSDGASNALKAAFTGCALWKAEVDVRNLFPVNHHLNWHPDWLASIDYSNQVGYWPLNESSGAVAADWHSTPFYFKFSGRIKDIRPPSGKFGSNAVAVTALDWFDDAALFKVGYVPTQINVTIDRAILQLVEYASSQPPGVLLTEGVDILPFTTHDIRSVNAVLGEISKLAATEFGYAYMRGTVNSEEVPGMALANESRHSRITNITPAFTITDDPTSDVIRDIDVSQDIAGLKNTIEITTHPADIDSDDVTISRLPTGVVLEVPSGGSYIYSAKYLDSDNAFKVVGAASIVPPVRNTDFIVSTEPTGTGTDLTNDYRQVLMAIDSDNLLAYFTLSDSPSEIFQNELDNTGTSNARRGSRRSRSEAEPEPITGASNGNAGTKVGPHGASLVQTRSLTQSFDR